MSDRGGPEIVYEWVRRIPPGFVTTYGELTPGAPRQAGRLLSLAPPGVPWWRVVRADGTLAKGEDQRRRLAAEGVPLRGSRVDLSTALLPHDALIDLVPGGGAAGARDPWSE